jgi:hypothetical protein
MRERDALAALIGGYLNEDWPEEYGDPWAAIERFVLWEPGYAPSVQVDVSRLIGRCASDAEVENALAKFGLGYAATNDGWATYTSWLLAVADRVEELLHKSPAA